MTSPLAWRAFRHGWHGAYLCQTLPPVPQGQFMCFTASNCLCCGRGNRKWCMTGVRIHQKAPPSSRTRTQDLVGVLCVGFSVCWAAHRGDARVILQPSSGVHLQLEGAHCAQLLAMSQIQLCSRASLCIPLQQLPVKEEKKIISGLAWEAMLFQLIPRKKKEKKSQTSRDARSEAICSINVIATIALKSRTCLHACKLCTTSD